MLKGFIDLKGNQIGIDQALESPHKCGVTRETLETMLDRPWNGKPSVTQLLRGTRESMLLIETDWYINPRTSGFMLLGTKVSSKLDNVDDRMELEGITGLPDHFTFDSEGILTDYKTTGSYKAGRALGLESRTIDDPSGATYQKSGRWGRAGQVKKIKVFTPTGSKDMFEWEMQVNMYRLMLENAGHEVKKMQIQAIIRDGGTTAAEANGFPRSGDNIINIPVKKLKDELVIEYFTSKRDALKLALEKKTAALCTPREAWDGRKCKYYCSVAEKCKEIGDNHWLQNN